MHPSRAIEPIVDGFGKLWLSIASVDTNHTGNRWRPFGFVKSKMGRSRVAQVALIWLRKVVDGAFKDRSAGPIHP